MGKLGGRVVTDWSDFSVSGGFDFSSGGKIRSGQWEMSSAGEWFGGEARSLEAGECSLYIGGV